MPFYDYYWRNQQVTEIGKRWMERAAQFSLRHIIKYTIPLNNLLEIGPGWGAFAKICNDSKITYTAIDANEGLLNRIEENRRICAYIPPIPTSSELWDAVIANHVIEHSSGLPQAQEMLSELSRVVRKGGCVGITSPDYLGYRNLFWDCDYSHNFPTSSRRLYQMFIDQGLEVVYQTYVHNHIKGIKGAIIGYLTQILPYRIFGSQPNSLFYIDRLYRLRLTFGRLVFIIGRKN
jgi:ubiquinone/menaquinone biosynthesis C-methylase UbiE